MAKPSSIDSDTVSASPVKSFFVSMLTRDIRLEEAILDLLDNCVDGILRAGRARQGSKPYRGFYANIEFRGDYFFIEDNCGGIPWNLHDYAFQMGRSDKRPPDAPGTVGVYGIGMKRAIFKMGEDCLISTQNGKDGYEVHIKPEWLKQEDDWKLPVKPSKKAMPQDGTAIYISSLYPGIAERFGPERADFENLLEDLIATHYAFILEKGFAVKINGRVVAPRPTKLIFDRNPGGRSSPAIRPFIFEGEDGGVKYFVAVGFTRPIPSEDDARNSVEEKKFSTEEAGWTVICNDRAVLTRDKTELTGWGEAGIPRYHTQFIAISGIVEFVSENPALLPSTTTKRGIDASSKIYLRVKNKMREGMGMFIDYTNRWKGHVQTARAQIENSGQPIALNEIKAMAASIKLKRLARSAVPGRQLRPKLPMPRADSGQDRRIAYSKPLTEIQLLGEYLFADENRSPSEVGEKCFEHVLRKARE